MTPEVRSGQPPVPAHWVVQRLDRVASVTSRQVDVTRINAQEVFHFSIPAVQATGTGAVEDGSEIASSKLLVDRPMVLVSKLNPRKGTVCLAEPRETLTVCSTEFVPLVPTSIDRKFLYHLATSELFRTRLEAMVTSVTNSHQRVDPSEIIKLAWGLPPLDEQRCIAAFLDYETARIDELVREQARLVALLEEEHGARLAALVLGREERELQRHASDDLSRDATSEWRPLALRYASRERCDGPFGSSLRSDDYTDQGCRVVRLQNIRARVFDDTDRAFIDVSYAASLGDHSVRAGDLLVAGLGDETNVVGRACVAPLELGPAIVKADCFRFRLDERVAVPEFVAAQLSASAVWDAGRLANGSTRSRIPLNKMASRTLCLPSVALQQKIVAELNRLDSRTRALQAEAQQASGLLRERRSALITAAVTGQIDVRSWRPPDDWFTPEAA